MPDKIQFYRDLADQTAHELTRGIDPWMTFLKTAARLYKYPFHEQLLIYAQRPDATACADYDLWNKTMRRYVKRGSTGIALLDVTQDRPRLKYVFDISDTGGKEKSRSLRLWQYQPEHENAVSEMLSGRYGVENGDGLTAQINAVISQLVREYWEDHRRDVFDILDDTYLREYDVYNIGVTFRTAAAVSTTYVVLERCGLHPEEHFFYDDFQSVFDFNTPEAVSVLGTAISEISERILRQIEITVKNYERAHSAERSQRHEQQPELSEDG